MGQIENFGRSLVAGAVLAGGCVNVNNVTNPSNSSDSQPAPAGDMGAAPDTKASPDLSEENLIDCPAPHGLDVYRLQDTMSKRVLSVVAEAVLPSVGKEPIVVSLAANPKGPGANHFATQTMQCTGVGTPHVFMEVPLSFDVTDVAAARFGIKAGQECRTRLYYYSSAVSGDTANGTEERPFYLPYKPADKSRTNGCFRY